MYPASHGQLIGHSLHQASKTWISRGITLVAHSVKNALLVRQWLVVMRDGCETVTGTTLNSAQPHKVTPLTMASTGRARMLKAAQSKVLTAVEANPQLLDLL